jgi:hypothetical protein
VNLLKPRYVVTARSAETGERIGDPEIPCWTRKGAVREFHNMNGMRFRMGAWKIQYDIWDNKTSQWI